MAIPYITTQITNNDDAWGALAIGISGNYIFWIGSPVGSETSPWELYLYNGNSTIKIPNSSTADYGSIKISDNKLAWVGRDGDGSNDYEVYFYDGNSTKKLTDNEIDASNVQLSANKVVWTENDGTDLEVYFYDGRFVQQLTNDNFPDYEIQVLGNRIIWIKQYPDNDPAPGDQADIFLYDGTNTINLSANLGQTSQTPKFLNDGRIFWTERYYSYYGPGDTERSFEYYIYDGNTISQLSLENAIGYEQVDTLYGVGVVGSIGNDLVFYDSNRVDGDPNTMSHAFVYDPDTNTITRITDRPDVNSIQVSGNNLLIDRISGLYLYKEGSLTELTTSPGRQSSAISGDRVIWSSYNNDYTISDVFLATPAPATAPTININDASIVELDNGTNNLTFSLTLSQALQQTVKVNYTTANNTATEGSDFTSTSGSITFNPGETTKTFTVPVRGDLIIEDHESFFVNLSSPINAVLARTQGVGYILNNDATSINILISDINISEGTSEAVFNVFLNAATNQTVTVNYATGDGSGLANNDYSSRAGTLRFNPGEVVKTITIPILEDTNSEETETFSLNFGDATNATLTDSQGIITILDNDAFPPLDPAQYGASHTDLIGIYGYNLEAFQQHYINYGRAEGRSIDRFDEFRYIASNTDLYNLYGANSEAATEHYIRYGYGEGRPTTAFDSVRYLLSHSDLLNAYGTNVQSASYHYVAYGSKPPENRNPNAFPSDRYIASHGDLIRAFGYNLMAGSEHYLYRVHTGVESRSISFSPENYLARNPDVAAHPYFGQSLTNATQHYILYGLNEGRS